MTAPLTEEQKKKAAATAEPATTETPAPAPKAGAWAKPMALANLAKPPDPEVLKQQQQAQHQAAVQAGLVAINGTKIAKKPSSSFSGNEKTAIEDALKAYDGGTQPKLTHPNSMKWGVYWGNNEDRLPKGNYKEYYVEKDPKSKTYHGDRRLVIDEAAQRVYYSATHYGDNGTPAFVQLRGPAPQGGGAT